MTSKRFNEILEQRIALMRSVLAAKKKEYATDDDRLRNFNRAAMIQCISPESALIGMWCKHLVSILEIVDNMDDGIALAPLALIQEKIGDAVNYLVLLESMLTDHFDAVKIPIKTAISNTGMIGDSPKKSKQKSNK